MPTIDVELTQTQSVAWEKLEDKSTNEILYGGGVFGGKTFLGCLWIITMALNYDESRWLIGRSKLKNLKQTTLATFFDVCKLLNLKPVEHFNYNAQNGEISFYNDSVIILKDLFLYPSDPNFDSLGSLEVSGAFIDECNQCVRKAVEVVKSRIRYKLKEFNIIPKMLMSCNPAKNWVFTEFFKPYEDNVLTDDKAFIQALISDNPHADPEYIKSLHKMDEASKQRLLYGNWRYDSDPTKLFEYDSIIDMWSNNYTEKGTMYITADIARLGEDKTVIYVWSGWQLIHALSFGKKPLDYTHEQLQRLSKEYRVQQHNIIVDEDGVGGGLVDFGNYTGFVNNSKAKMKTNYANLKSQCYFEIAKMVNNGEIAIKFTDSEIKSKLIEDLEQIRDWNSDKDEKIRVIPKDKIKEMTGRSTDYSDPFMMRMYFVLVPPPKTMKIKGLM